MPRVSREQADKNRTVIEAASVRLFKEHGLNGVSVADIMGAAGLTHGGFYGHFESKDELAAIACAQAFEESITRWRSLMKDDAGEQSHVDALAKHYLNAAQRDQPGLSCAAAGLAVDVGRETAGKPIRAVYTRGIRSMIDVLMSFSSARRSRKVRQRAIARLSIMIGALTLSRAVGNDPLSDEILAAAREALHGGLA
jgi:TetR/AcrR family transcriptional regulator, transcriptional repressor for nem operon